MRYRATDTSSNLGRYSYLAADPFCQLRIDKPHPEALNRVRQLSAKYYCPRLPDLPPLQGGWMGWFGYELGQCFESVPHARFNEFQLPLASLGMYDVVLAWDHHCDQGWIISQGWPATNPKQRTQRAYERLKQFLRQVELAEAPPPRLRASSVVRQSRLAPQYATRWSSEWTSNFSPEQFRDAVGRCVEYVYAGDIFQVNLAQRLLTRASGDSASLYQHLRAVNPAPFSGYADFGRIQVISVSPERFLKLESGRIETRPIKGTRPRISDPIADAAISQMLLESEKDRSENIMIVDLMRNDLSRISRFDSIEVSALCALERHPFVWHLVSVVQSQLKDALGATDVIAASFPGGSISGAPKVRAMEIIAELEPTVRGPYCGSLGYISFAGDMDLSILIRTVTACDGWWQVPVGGGIVAESDPKLEEQETWHKAEGILRAIDSMRT